MDFLKEISTQIQELLPPSCEIAKIELEGPEIVIYTKNIGAFMQDETLVKTLAAKLKKRFVLRSDVSQLMPPEQALAKIKEIIPADAGVESIDFDDEFNRVNITAEKLGLVIGPQGSILKEITLQTKWTPKLLRKPVGNCEIVKGIRETLLKENKDVKKNLKAVGKNIYRSQAKPTDWIRLTALGGAQEVGRSCFLIETPESKVLMDCGVNVAAQGEASFPYLSSIEFSLEELDAVILSHGHLDHSGFIPYLYSYGYTGPVYCTPATRDVMAMLQLDYHKVLERTAKDAPYTEKHIKEEVKHVIPREYGEVTDITPDVRLTLHNAGHLLGSSLIHLHIGEGAHNLLYTGDMNFGFTELFNSADTDFPRLETLMIESTYGGPQSRQPNRALCEERLYNLIKETTTKNGIVLIPSFAVGRAQEIQLVLERFAKQGEWDIPVYLDGMLKQASAMHTVYPEYLRRGIQRRILHNDSPFESNIFQLVDPKQRDQIIQNGRCVILASSGMMVGGPIIDYFRKTCEDEKNALVFVGYQSEGSLGRTIQRGKNSVLLEDETGKVKEHQIKMHIDTIAGFSVSWDTPILIRENNLVKIVNAGEFVDNYLEGPGTREISGIEAPAFDKNGKISFKTVTHVIKHVSKGKMLEITTKTGRKVKVSKGHSLFRLKNKEVETIPSDKLSLGDHIVIPRKLPENEFISVNDAIPKLYGYYTAEGHVEDTRFTLSFGAHEQNLIDDACTSIRSLGLNYGIHNPHPTETQIQGYGKLWTNKIQELCGKGSYNKKVPIDVFNMSKENRLLYLKAYFDGDGHLDTHSRRKYLTAKSVSSKLISDLSYLLLQEGIVTKLRKEKTKEHMLQGNLLKSSEVHKILISGGEFEPFNPQQSYPPYALPLAEIDFSDLLPKAKDLETKRLVKSYIHNMKQGKKYIGISVLKKILSKVNDQKLQKLVDGDILFDPIISIKEVEGSEYEYDISVKECENFCGGFGGIMLHNSGHADIGQLLGYMKKIHPKPERVLTVHGEQGNCANLARTFSYKFRVEASAPRNLDSIRLK